ncbi:hypothetical protein [Methylobacterium pseudosasicola]|uniref:Uncharacterized protein n=1 Tax=Methylobacterium pseudosasicola TaxID=582667 RepID=A0A1I4RVV9_9HYPH|nr:hypothetical protein [Methylobacterium pseudosasicola]SFM56372.1 hypothetical protein SAMN05192568_103821 [Methylobacterium pseudosasicola]
MTGAIIPLRLKRDQTSALAGFDVLAAELLVEGKAPNLSAARLDAILGKLREQRTQLAVILAHLEERVPSCDAWIEAIDADLRDFAREGLTQIARYIQQAMSCRMKVEPACITESGPLPFAVGHQDR